jgi:catechol 2,3-dioxygenase-like lactoylglutathione lyase family enzyme
VAVLEYIVGKLLSDFESGKISRRELVRSIALAASAVSAASPSLAAPAAPAFHAAAVNHISYSVADYAKTRDFYADLFGMKVSHDNGRECYMEFGATHLIPRNARPGAPTPRVDHIAYTIGDWDRKAVEEELKRRGLSPRPDEETSFHVKDPDGFDLQICSKEMKP